MMTISNTQLLLITGIASFPFIYWYFFSKNKNQLQNRTGFDSFLKQKQERRPQTRDPSDFTTFLKTNNQNQNQQLDGFTKKEDDDENSRENSTDENLIRIPIFFGTEYGFSEEIACELERKLSCDEFGEIYQAVLYDMADYPNGFSFKGEQVVLVICSTSGDGVPPAYARAFCEWLRDGADGGSGLEDIYFSVLALGDKSYNHFCKCGKDVESYFEKLGSKRFVDRVDVDCEDWDAIRSWMSQILSGLNELPLVRQETDNSQNSNENNIQIMSGWNKKNPYFAKILTVEGLCQIENQKTDKNTLRIEIDLGDSELSYIAGDALGIYALNDPSQVQNLLTALNLTGEEKISIPKWNFNKVDLIENDGKISVRDAFLRCFDLRQPKPEILDLLTQKIPQLKEKEFQKPFLEERHLIDIIQEYNQKIELNTLIHKYLRPLQPRLYSISSSPLEKQNNVQITVAEVKYESLAVERTGVASTFLSERIEPKISKIPVYITANPEFRLPEKISTPIIMVGPGTGLAPFRAFIMQRMYEMHEMRGMYEGTNTQQQYGTMVLYFGCRRRDQDYLYGEQLEKWAQEKIITLYTAFSREIPGKKVYVQHKLKENGQKTWELIDQFQAHFYVCGDAARMAGDVEDVLLGIVQEYGKRDEGGAREYLEGLTAQGRYQKDVWY